MKTLRRIGLMVAWAFVILGIICAVLNRIDDRCSRVESATHPKPIVQEVPFR